MLMRVRDASPDATMVTHFSLGALAMLELAGGEALGNSGLDFLRGCLLASPVVRRYPEGVAVLERVVTENPDFPQAAESRYHLGRALARTGRHEQAISTLERALAHEYDPKLRALALLEIGRERMFTQQPELAMISLRQAITEAPDPEVVALGYYDLAAALDRAGDLPAALRAAAAADRLDPARQTGVLGDAFDLPLVGLEPESEVHYRRALAAMARQTEADSPESAREELGKAIQEWIVYLRQQSAQEAPWKDNAAKHLEACRRKLGELHSDASTDSCCPSEPQH